MTSLGTLPRLAVVASLLTAAACADEITRSRTEAREAASEPVPTVATTPAAPPTLAIVTRAWNYGTTDIPPLSGFYRVLIDGAGFPVGANYQSRTEIILLDGTVWQLGSGQGVIPSDGTYRTDVITNCPSRVREVYEIVIAGGVRTESKHVTPAC